MRSFSVSAVITLGLGIALAASVPAFGQFSSAPHHKLFGYRDEAGVFHPVSSAEPDASTAPTTGTVEVTITTALKTALPKGGTVVCGIDLTGESINDSTGTVEIYEEQAYVQAAVSGSTATCTVNVPYSWTLQAASTGVSNTLGGQYTVEMNGAAGAAVPVVRLTDSAFVSGVKIPATGTISKYTVAAAL